MTNPLRRGSRGATAGHYGAAVVLLSVLAGCHGAPRGEDLRHRQEAPPLARKSLPEAFALPLTGAASFFDDRLTVAIRIDSTHPDEETAGSEKPEAARNRGTDRAGKKTGLTGGVQVQTGNGGGSANAEIGYNVGGATVGASAGSGGAGGLCIGLGNGGGRGGRAGPAQPDGRRNPRVGGAAANPPAVIRLTFTNRGTEPLAIIVVDFLSPLGSGPVRPARFVVAPGATAESEPLYSFLDETAADTAPTLVLRVGGERETRTIALHAPPGGDTRPAAAVGAAPRD